MKSQILVTLFLLAALPVDAQLPLPGDNPSPTPVRDPEAPGTPILLADAGIDVVIPLLEDLFDKNIIVPQGLPNVRLNFQPSHPMTREEQLVALESLLTINGLTVISISDKLMKIVPSAQAALNAPELILGPLAPLPPSERVVSKLFELGYVKADEATAVIQPVLSQASVITEPRQGWLLITDQLGHLKRIETLLSELDRPSRRSDTVRFYDLKFAPAEEVAERIETLSSGFLQQRLGGGFTISTDQRSNRILIATHPDNFPIFESIIESLDVDAAPLTQSEVFYIKHAKAEEVVAVIEQVVTGQQQAAEQEETSAAGRNREGTAQVTPSPEGGATLETRASAAIASAAESGTALQFSEYVTLASDERANAIVVYGTPADIRQISNLIDKIDVLLAQVRLEVIITEVTLNEGMVRGLDVFGLSYNLDGDDEITLSEGTPLRLGGLVVNALTVQDFSIDAIFQTAKSNGNVSVISSPTILTTHNQPATINVSQDIPIVTGTVTSDESTSTRSTIDRVKVGINLEVKPLVAPDGIIQMEIKQTVDNVVSVISNSDNPDLNGQPIIGTREAESFVSVRDNDIIVLGGLQENTETLSENRLALFGHIPWLGDALFTRKERTVQTRELMIFIKPTVLFTADDAAVDGRKVLNKLEESDRVRDFVEQGHLRPYALDKIEDWKAMPEPTEYRPAPVDTRHLRTLPKRDSQ